MLLYASYLIHSFDARGRKEGGEKKTLCGDLPEVFFSITLKEIFQLVILFKKHLIF